MRINRLAVAALIAVGAVSCGGSDDTAGPSPSPTPSQPAASSSDGGTVEELKALPGRRWSVGTLTLKVGDSVKVVDADPDDPHNFTVDGVGHSPTMSNGDTFVLRFDKAGTFGFVCTFHESQGMTGTITVS